MGGTQSSAEAFVSKGLNSGTERASNSNNFEAGPVFVGKIGDLGNINQIYLECRQQQFQHAYLLLIFKASFHHIFLIHIFTKYYYV